MLSNLKQTTKHMQAFHSGSLLSRISVCKSKFQKGGGRQKDQWTHTPGIWQNLPRSGCCCCCCEVRPGSGIEEDPLSHAQLAASPTPPSLSICCMGMCMCMCVCVSLSLFWNLFCLVWILLFQTFWLVPLMQGVWELQIRIVLSPLCVVGGGWWCRCFWRVSCFCVSERNCWNYWQQQQQKTTHHAERFARCKLKTVLYKSFFFKTFRSHIHAKQVYLQNPKTLNPRNIPAVV